MQQPLTEPGFEEKIRFISAPNSYSEKPSTIERIETHFSILLLLDSIVLKLKKPVQTDFLDLRPFEARTFCVNEEIRLNKRLAPDTYIGIVAIYFNHKGYNFSGNGQISDWMVKMHKLPADRMLDYCIKNKNIPEAGLSKAALLLSAFYHTSNKEQVEWRNIKTKLEQEVISYQKVVSQLSVDSNIRQTVSAIANQLLRFVNNHQTIFTERIAKKIYVEGHGDLRPEHICLTDPPQIFDCLEFDKSLRIIDPAEELSFLAMECELSGSQYVGRYMFDYYQQHTGDFIPYQLIQFYKAKRAFLRAKLTSGHLLELQYMQDNHWVNKTQDYLKLAMKYAEQLPG